MDERQRVLVLLDPGLPGMDEPLARVRAAVRRSAPAEGEAVMETDDSTPSACPPSGPARRRAGPADTQAVVHRGAVRGWDPAARKQQGDEERQ